MALGDHPKAMIKRKKPLRRTPLRRVSKKKAKTDAEYMKLRRAFLIAHPWCQHWLAERGLTEGDVMLNVVGGAFVMKHGPVPRSTEIHHKKGRGKHMLDTSTWMAVRPGHAFYIHNNLSHSRKMGYILDK